MNRQQAEQILRLYRPDADDARDADFAKALELARQDVELASWFQRHCAEYKLMRARFAAIPVPAGLKEQIIAEREQETKIVSTPKLVWHRWPLAIAAALVLLVSIFAFWLPLRVEKQYSSFRNRMLNVALRGYSMDLETADFNRIRAFLADNHAPSQFVLPDGLRTARKSGCAVLRWQNQPVSMICFRTGKPLQPGQSSDLFLFVMDRSVFEKIAWSLQIEQVNQLATARWVEGDQFYFVATRGDEAMLRKFL